MTTENNESAQSTNNADSANKESEVKSAADLIYGKSESSDSDANAQDKESDKEDTASDDVESKEEDKGGAEENKEESKEEPKDEAKDDSKESKEGDDLEVVLPKESKLSKEDAEAVKAFAKEHKLSKEQAEVVLKLSDKAVNGYLEAQKTQLKQTVTQWEKQAKADPDIGGDKYAQSVEIAKKGYKNAPASMRNFLNETGLGSHPDVVKFFYRLGKLGLNDKMVPSGSEAKNEPKSHAQLIYG